MIIRRELWALCRVEICAIENSAPLPRGHVPSFTFRFAASQGMDGLAPTLIICSCGLQLRSSPNRCKGNLELSAGAGLSSRLCNEVISL